MSLPAEPAGSLQAQRRVSDSSCTAWLARALTCRATPHHGRLWQSWHPQCYPGGMLEVAGIYVCRWAILPKQRDLPPHTMLKQCCQLRVLFIKARLSSVTLWSSIFHHGTHISAIVLITKPPQQNGKQWHAPCFSLWFGGIGNSVQYRSFSQQWKMDGDMPVGALKSST